jgi:hypothetical protein
VRKHNALTNENHLPLYNYVVIGHELIAERDIVRFNLSSPWMLANELCVIITEWNFQICADFTGNFCIRSVDLPSSSLLGHLHSLQNNVLCLSIILKATESEKVYKLTYNDLLTVVSLLCKVLQCSKSYCECCSVVRELLAEQNLVDFLTVTTSKHRSCR